MEIVGQPGSPKLAEQLNLPLRAVTPDYFAAMNIQVADGRVFRSSDDADAPEVAVINAAFARRYFAAGTPIGRIVKFIGDKAKPIEIIGVVSDTRTNALSEQAEPEIYFPLWQRRAFSKNLILHTRADPRALATLVQRELHAVDPTAAVEHVKTMEDVRQESVAPQPLRHASADRLFGDGDGARAGRPLRRAVAVGRGADEGNRGQEGDRCTLAGDRASGASRRVPADRARCGVGPRAGTRIGSSARRAVVRVKAADPMTLIGAAVLFAALALIACAVPAWRAARVNLMDALRHE